MIRLSVNGQPRELDVDPSTPLLWVKYVNLELFLAWRAQGLPVETPGVRR